MKDVKKILIGLYAKHEVARLDNNATALFEAAFGEDYSQFYLDPLFVSTNKSVRKAKLLIQNKDFGSIQDTRRQISECLALLWSIVVMEDPESFGTTTEFQSELEILVELIRASFAVSWTSEQQAFFNQHFERIVKQDLYFISYTNGFAPIVNRKYYSPIGKYVASEKQYSRLDQVSKNILAECFYIWLYKKNYKKGFFDLKSIRISEDIPVSVAQRAGNSFAFIQLVDTASLENKTNNWCFKEYNEYTQARNCSIHRFFYITIQGTLPADIDRVHPNYHGWYNVMSQDTKRVDFYKSVKDLDSFSSTMEQLLADIHAISMDEFAKVP